MCSCSMSSPPTGGSAAPGSRSTPAWRRSIADLLSRPFLLAGGLSAASRADVRRPRRASALPRHRCRHECPRRRRQGRRGRRRARSAGPGRGLAAWVASPTRCWPRPLPVIMEVKRRDGNGVELIGDRTIAEIVGDYMAAGAPCISVVTGRWFGGEEAMLDEVVGLTSLPILKKDFITRESQIVAAKEAGASAILLTARILPKSSFQKLIETIFRHELTPFVEVADHDELDSVVHADECIVAINNKDIRHQERDAGDLDLSRSLLEATIATGTPCPVSAERDQRPAPGRRARQRRLQGPPDRRGPAAERERRGLGARVRRAPAGDGYGHDRAADVPTMTASPTTSLGRRQAASRRPRRCSGAVPPVDLRRARGAARAGGGRAGRARPRARGYRSGMLAKKSPEASPWCSPASATRRPFLLPSIELAARHARRLFAQAGCQPRAAPAAGRRVVERARGRRRRCSRACRRRPGPPDGVAFMLTTSGSTGLPKIVPLSPAAVDRFTDWAAGQFEIAPGTTVLNYAPLNFDLCLLDIWSTLKAGRMRRAGRPGPRDERRLSGRAARRERGQRDPGGADALPPADRRDPRGRYRLSGGQARDDHRRQDCRPSTLERAAGPVPERPLLQHLRLHRDERQPDARARPERGRFAAADPGRGSRCPA